MKNFCAICTLILLIHSGISANAQQSSATFDWAANPVLHTLNKSLTKESAVYVVDKRVIEYVDDVKTQSVMINATYHTIIKVNNDRGIELFNKIYVPVNPSIKLESLKARTISPAGKVINLPDNKIFDTEEDGRTYKKFALEGVEKGSEIEYIYTVKKNASFYATEYFQSTSAAYQNAAITIIAPERLVFDMKGYNGFTVKPDTVIDHKRILNAFEENIPVFRSEKYAADRPNKVNVQYKLSYNLSKNPGVRVYTWSELAKNVYANYTEFSEKELKAIQLLIKQMNISESSTEEDKIETVEEFLKMHINASDDFNSADAYQLDKVIKSGNSSKVSLNRLFIGVFEKLNIAYQIVFPSKRDDFPLDEALENYNNIDEMIFYFPRTEKYLEPVNKMLRYPFVDPYWAATKGLFLKGTSIGNFKTAIASFDSIAIQPYEQNYMNIEADVSINDSRDSVQIKLKQIFGGYSAAPYRAYYLYLQPDKIIDFNKDLIKGVINTENIRNIKVTNTAMSSFNKSIPFMIESEIASADLIENAGPKMLIKMGDIIGPQAEMYQEQQRKLPILLQYPHALDRKIKFTIPKGYQVTNLKDINFNVVHKDQGVETMGFISEYTISGSELSINIHEFYKQLEYPVSMITEFTNVINASADFNKVVLVLEKRP